MTFDISNPIFQDKEKAREYLESVRWPDGPFCPHCGVIGNSKHLTGKSHRPGLYQCNSCRKQFTVTVGTVFERSKVPLNKWLLATFLLSSSKKGMSAHQLHRMLGVTYKTAWFMFHRIREAMRDDNPGPMGGKGQAVEVDETYIGTTDKAEAEAYLRPDGKWHKNSGTKDKRKIISLVQRNGNARSFHVDRVSSADVGPIVFRNVLRESTLHTDESPIYGPIAVGYAGHEKVNHSKKEYARGNVTTNSVEGYFSIFKRGMKGVYQHCGEQHLHRYLSEFDFRYNHRKIEDIERTQEALRGIEGKRLTYRRANRAQTQGQNQTAQALKA